MFTQVEINNGLLNVAQLHEKVDEIIFDYIDTSKNWGKGYKGLNNLFQQTVQFYVKYVDENGNPKSNLYWTLFLDVVGRLVYFRTLAEKHLTDLPTNENVDNFIKGYVVAAACLQNANTNQEHELLDEINESFKEIHPSNSEKGIFNHSILENTNSLEEVLLEFYNYCSTFTKVNQS